MPLATDERLRFRVSFSGGTPGATLIPVPVLGGTACEEILAPAEPAGSQHGFTLFRADDWLGGITRLSLQSIEDLEETARRIYRSLLELSSGRHLVRVWNYIPAINAERRDRLENYRAFCRGRSLAFEETFGDQFTRRLPAASAVGIVPLECIVGFVACATPPRYVENPAQTPAYLYPVEHGPRPPSFARASVVNTTSGATVYISGTASIRGHASFAPNDTGAQTICTVANLRSISVACGLGEDLARTRASSRMFKVYLRHASDYTDVSTYLAAQLLAPGDQVTYLHADVCRRELNVEIEALVRTKAE